MATKIAVIKYPWFKAFNGSSASLALAHIIPTIAQINPNPRITSGNKIPLIPKTFPNAPKIIAESEKIEADQAKKQAELDSLEQELSKKEAALEIRIGKQISEADEADKKLKSRESAVAAREAAVRNGMDDIANRESELQRHRNAHMINLKSHAEKVSDLDAREEAIAMKEAEAEAMKKRLQDYAANLKAHAEGIVL